MGKLSLLTLVSKLICIILFWKNCGLGLTSCHGQNIGIVPLITPRHNVVLFALYTVEIYQH